MIHLGCTGGLKIVSGIRSSMSTDFNTGVIQKLLGKGCVQLCSAEENKYVGEQLKENENKIQIV